MNCGMLPTQLEPQWLIQRKIEQNYKDYSDPRPVLPQRLWLTQCMVMFLDFRLLKNLSLLINVRQQFLLWYPSLLCASYVGKTFIIISSFRNPCQPFACTTRLTKSRVRRTQLAFHLTSRSWQIIDLMHQLIFCYITSLS